MLMAALRFPHVPKADIAQVKDARACGLPLFRRVSACLQPVGLSADLSRVLPGP